MSVWFVVATLLFIALSIVLVLVILVQRPQGGGLAGAFGGAGGGGTDTAFGGRTGDVLTMATCVVFSLFLLLAVGLNIMDNPVAAGATPGDTPIVNSTGILPAAPQPQPLVPVGDPVPVNIPIIPNEGSAPGGTGGP